jgi:hypothetical protein
VGGAPAAAAATGAPQERQKAVPATIGAWQASQAGSW